MVAALESPTGYTLGKLQEYGIVRHVERSPVESGAYVVVDLVPVRNGVRTNRRYQVIFVVDDTRQSPCEQKRIGSARTLSAARAIIDAACDPLAQFVAELILA